MPPNQPGRFGRVISILIVLAIIKLEFHPVAVSSADVELFSTELDTMKWSSLLNVTTPSFTAPSVKSTVMDADFTQRFSSIAPVTSEDDGPAVVDIWLIGLFPLKGSWPGGLGQLPAVEMGLEDVNADPSILPGYRLRMTIDDTECDPGIGTNALYDQLYRHPKKTMVLGAGCSGVSEATAQVSHLWNLVQLSYSSASPKLSDKNLYKRFFRVFPPESSFNPAKLDLLDTYNWKKIGTLHEANQLLFSQTTHDFLLRAASRGIKVITSESFTGDPRQQVRNLKKHGVRIIVGNFYENKACVIFCEAYKEGMFGSKYAWIITGFYSKQWWKKRDPDNPHDCTVDQLEEAIQGYFTADALPSSLSETPGISGKTTKEFNDEYDKRTNWSEKTGHQEAPYGYDSVWTAALILNTSLQIMKNSGWNRSIDGFQYNDTEMGDLFWNLVNQTNFQGVSGPVMFDEIGDRKGLTQIEQLQGHDEVKVGVYDPSSEEINKIRWSVTSPIQWKDKNPPPDSITEKITPIVISVGLFILMTVLAALGVVMSIMFLVFNIRYRQCKYIKMSSPNMNNFILIGAILAFLSIIFGGTNNSLVTPVLHPLMCKLYNWTLALGFSLAFGAMFSKTWRVHKIFTNKKIQRMVIRDYQLAAIVFVMGMLDVLVLSIWEAIDPLDVFFYNKTMEYIPDPTNDNQVLIPQSRFCESTHMWYFAGLLYAIKGLLLLFGAFLAFETRKVTVPALNDSKFIGISVYNVVVLCLIGVPTVYMIREQVDAAYTLISLFTFFATTLTICLIFIPKVIKRNREPHSGARWSKSTENKRTSSSVVVSTPVGTGILTADEFGDYKRELEKLRVENHALKEALEECQYRLNSADVNSAAHHTRSEILHFADLPSPATQTQRSDMTASPTTLCPSYSPGRALDEDAISCDDVALHPPFTSSSSQSFIQKF